MPKLVLQLEDRVLRECALSADVTIGRQPDNTVSVDNPAVSARHARIARHSDGFIVEDLESRNGTFVNGERVGRRVLRHGDVVLVGKHKLVFDAEAADGDAGANTAYLLTTDAVQFFERMGFRRIERSAAPADILSTRQAALLCPSTAALMARRTLR